MQGPFTSLGSINIFFFTVNENLLYLKTRSPFQPSPLQKVILYPEKPEFFLKPILKK